MIDARIWHRGIFSLLSMGLLSMAARSNELPQGGTAAEAAPNTADASADAFFDIGEFRVLGNSVLQPIDIERAIYNFAGPHKTIQDVQAARVALETAYHNAGYGTVFVDIPEQDASAGIVRLRATEGRIDRMHVTGIRYFSSRKMLAQLPSVQPGTVPKLPALQSELAAVNAESADRSVTPILKAGQTPGTVDLELRVNDNSPFHAGLTLNNRYTPETTHLRSIVDVSYGNLFQDMQSLAFEYQTAPERSADARTYSLTYIAPLGSKRNLLAVYAIDNTSDVSTVGALSLLGVGQVYGVHFIHPVIGADGWSQNLNAGADFKNFTQTVNVLGAPPDKTPIRYMNWSTAYTLSQHADRYDTSFNLAANFGLRGVVNDPAQFDYKRYQAKADYFYLRGSAERRDSIPFGFSLDERIGFQVADGPLVSNEQFGIGGIDTVRGYEELMALGDSGAALSIELRGPTWSFGENAADNHLGLYVFYDVGSVSTLRPLPQQITRMSIEGAGAGMRLIAFRSLDAMLEWAVPLKTLNPVLRGHSRLDFQLHYGF